jgi:hypothetical protein
MNPETYWRQVVHRVYDQHEILHGKEELFYRWSCIYGETMVDGIEAYFERRFTEFEADMAALRLAGFDDIASEFQKTRTLMFGNSALGETAVENRITELMTESEEVQPVLAEIDKIYRRVIPRLEELAKYKYEYGLREHLYSEDTGPKPPCPAVIALEADLAAAERTHQAKVKEGKACPKCGFSYSWNGVVCAHCRYRSQ